MDRIEFNKIAKKIQSRLSRKGIAVSLEDLRNHMETMEDFSQETELKIEQYWVNTMSKPVLTNNESSDLSQNEQGMVDQSSDRAPDLSNLATIQKTENLVARAAQKLDLTLTKDEIRDLASEFTEGYSVAIEDSERVLKLLRDWILHQERLAAIQLEQLQNELEDVVTESHERTHKRVKGLLATSKERQSDYLDRHKKEMESIYHFFGELMPGTEW